MQLAKSDPESIDDIFRRVCHYRYPEQLFGDLGTTTIYEQKAELKRRFNALAKLYYPSNYPLNSPEYICATDLFKIINKLYQQAQEKITSGTYQQKIPVDSTSDQDSICIIKTAKRSYRLIEQLVEGQHADLFLGEYDDPNDPVLPLKKVVIKIASSYGKNPLINTEIRFHQALAHFSLPEFIDSFTFPKDRKDALIMNFINGLDLEQVREIYPHGIPDRHAAWILDRLLSVIGLLHYNDILHGYIEPANIMLEQDAPSGLATHNVFLIDFVASLVKPSLKSLMTVFDSTFTAPELSFIDPSSPHPTADLYALGKSMIYLLGGNLTTDEVPNSVDIRFKAFLNKLLEDDPSKRANDAWEMNDELQKLRKKIFGASHEFLRLELFRR